MKINFYNETEESVFKYERLIKSIFKPMGSKKFFNVIFVSMDEIHRINKEYRNIDRPTDVISFAQIDDKEEARGKEMGDIFICLDKAREQAKEYGHSIVREVAFLSVHGYLHLSGYDHQTKEEENVMFAKQDEILNKAGIKR